MRCSEIGFLSTGDMLRLAMITATSNAVVLSLAQSQVHQVLGHSWPSFADLVEAKSADAMKLIAVTKYGILIDAPRWFEHPLFAVFETKLCSKSWVYQVVLGWLVVAPFVACAGKLMTVILGAHALNGRGIQHPAISSSHSALRNGIT